MIRKNAVIRRLGVSVYPANHPKIRTLSKTVDDPSIHGDKVWDASFILMDFFNQFPLSKGARVLDVGCGWGALTCFLARKFNARVTGIDADATVKHYFDFHLKANRVEAKFIECTMEAMTIDKLKEFDVIVGGDICFWDDLKLAWQGLIERALEAGVKEIYLADPGRQPFWDLTDYCQEMNGAELWSHEINKPIKTEHYVMEIAR